MRVGAIAPGQSVPRSGPKGFGRQVAVGAGAYTSITNVYGPAQAGSGEKVNIQVVVRNLAGYAIYIAVTGRYNGTDLAFTPEYTNVAAGGSYSFTTSFTMPNKNITLDTWSFYWTGTAWYQDDHKAVSISRVWVWIPLASATLTVKRAGVGAWIPLASASLTIKRSAVGAWIALASTSLSVKKAAVGAWVPLSSVSLTLKMAMVGGWVPLATVSSVVAVGIAAGKDIFKSLAVDFEKSLPKEFEKTA